MITTAFVTAAGSSGKTTTAVNLAVALHDAGRRVLVIDADPQADATLSLGCEPDDNRLGVGDVLTGAISLDDTIVPTDSGVDLIPSRPGMSQPLGAFAGMRGADMLLRNRLTGHQGHDVVLIDCPGQVTDPVTIAAAVAADTILTTTHAAGKESKGISEVEAMAAGYADAYGVGGAFAGVIPCAVMPPSRNSAATGHLEAIRAAYGDELTLPTVRWSSLVIHAYDAREPLLRHAPASAVARDYRGVHDALVERGVWPR